MHTPTLVRTAIRLAGDPDSLYPYLAGMADFSLPYIGRLTRTMTQPGMGGDYFRNVIRDVADDYTFTTEFVRDAKFYAANRERWTDPDSDNMGRAYHDMILHQTEDVSL